MTRSVHLELVHAEADDLGPPPREMEPDTPSLRLNAAHLARNLAWVPSLRESHDFRERCRSLSHAFKPLLAALESPPARTVPDDLCLLRENILLLEMDLEDTRETFKRSNKTPQAVISKGAIVPRIAALAEDYLAAAGYEFGEVSFTDYIKAFQEITVLNMAELWALIPALKLVLLEQIAERGGRLLRDPNRPDGLHTLVRSLRDIRQTCWKVVIEPLILFDHILRQDPAGAYSRMDYESRDLYRTKLVSIADHSDCSELEVAGEVLALALEAAKHADENPRVTQRRSHVGTYLLGEGTTLLEGKVGFRPSLAQRLRSFLRTHPDECYLLGITVLTVAVVLSVVVFLTEPTTSLGLVLLSLLAVLLPSSQSAVQIMNSLVSQFLPPEILPKLDLSGGLPAEFITLVSIPTLLFNKERVHKLVDDLEVRFLANHDPNLHFALVTDLPDSPTKPQEDNALVDLCSDLIHGLNEKYAGKGMGSFFLLHRRPTYNPRERLWMGWERKRGKLMDLNNLLRGQFDSFPVKVGSLSTLPKVRFVITLDSDTELPRGAARRMVGALAHPLNQAILDPERGIVVAGYGILQPRVEVSVQSTARSRLASIYSGETGLDIYTRAASDVYQDLYGEGIFVGKGIYEVEMLHGVLDRRFPRNALLSHDLIEGAYARAGLVSDIEVIEDYPSHYCAHYRRKHRWLRGDWQIAGWLLPLVPDEAGRQIPNPLSVISQWKIFDNLRRSLVEPALFTLLLLGWVVLPGRTEYWTLAAIVILFLPALCQLGFEVAKAAAMRKRTIIRVALNTFLNASVAAGLTVTFLAHQALLSMDAMIRTMVRRVLTRRRLLQWETAAQAEIIGYKRTALDIYLNWAPALALALFLLVWIVHRQALFAALPILVLWACSKPISLWLNRPPRAPRKQASEKDQRLLRLSALRTWRYFAGFSTEEHHWLIPDNVREDPARVASRISPTNLGLLLNARQVACEFGYLTVPEFAQETLHTLSTLSQLQRYRGHLLNWYDTRSLVPLAPSFVSTVDSGNLLASLWTLERGCRQLLDQPLLQPELAGGFLDHLFLLTTPHALPLRRFSATKKALQSESWREYLLDVPDSVLKDIHKSPSPSKNAADAVWLQEQAEGRISQVSRAVQRYAPWLLPEFAALRDDPAILLRTDQGPAIKGLPRFIDDLAARLKTRVDSTDPGGSSAVHRELLSLLPDARSHIVRLIEDLKNIADEASRLADGMDFGFLLNRSRGLLSIGFDVEKQQLHGSCYDLLASEARIAYFVAIAKDDIPQESWFQLGRPNMLGEGITGLLSWTGTMFEYLMPLLWMRSYPNTLLERAATVAVRSQRAYAGDKGIPWGISESACLQEDDAGNYQYHAFGVPQLAIHKVEMDGPVVSPYSTFLTLLVDPSAALRNLRNLRPRRSIGAYGFYEALDFSPSRRRSRLRRFELVRCWMAHHQGMSLLSIANFLHDDVVQRWFHSHPRVQAAELLLQEKPAGPVRPKRSHTNAA
jgi:cyclic beta-1,2-glucan synthetase